MKALFKKRCGRLAFESAFKSAGIGSDATKALFRLKAPW